MFLSRAEPTRRSWLVGQLMSITSVAAMVLAGYEAAVAVLTSGLQTQFFQLMAASVLPFGVASIFFARLALPDECGTLPRQETAVIILGIAWSIMAAILSTLLPTGLVVALLLAYGLMVRYAFRRAVCNEFCSRLIDRVVRPNLQPAPVGGQTGFGIVAPTTASNT